MAVLRHIRWLSLHIALGAICVLYFVDVLQGLQLPIPAYICLFVAVWAIYLLDHKLDAQKGVVCSARRLFHRRAGKVINLLLVLNLLVGSIFAFFLPGALLVAGGVFALLSAFYLAVVSKLGKHNVKELLSAIFYALGIFLAALAYGELWVNLLMAMQLALLAFANLVLFSIYEREADEQEGFLSIATNLGNGRSLQILWSTLVALLLTTAVLHFYLPWRYEVFIFLGSVTLWILSWRQDLFRTQERYRMLADLVFILPMALLG